MNRPISRLLVIDASVARSAGETEHPVSSTCREFLLAVRTICHRVALTTEMNEEWSRHMSKFTRKWRVSMAARRKPIQVVNPSELSVSVKGLSEADRRAIQKDQCLLEAAFSADRVIVTRDDSLRQVLARMPQGQQWLEMITWINPVSDGIAALKRL